MKYTNKNNISNQTKVQESVTAIWLLWDQSATLGQTCEVSAIARLTNNVHVGDGRQHVASKTFPHDELDCELIADSIDEKHMLNSFLTYRLTTYSCFDKHYNFAKSWWSMCFLLYLFLLKPFDTINFPSCSVCETRGNHNTKSSSNRRVL